MYQDALSKYDKAKEHYDDVFGYYAKAFQSYMALELDDFMDFKKKKGFRFFTCTVKGATTPCDSTSWYQKLGGDLKMDWHITDKKAFSDELMAETGIDESWFEYGEKIGGIVGTGTAFGSGAPIINPSGSVKLRWVGYPVMKDNFDVPNPKEIMDKVIPGANELLLQMQSTEIDIITGAWGGEDEDVVQVYSIPAFFLSQSIENIEKVKKIGADLKKDEQKELILNIITAIFSVVPFVGQIGSMAAGLSKLARFFMHMGIASNAGLGVGQIIEDPKMAPVAILGILMGFAGRGSSGVARGSEAEMKEIAKLRNGMNGAVLRGLGPAFERNEQTLQSIATRNICLRR
ncbi:hypothetical protein EJ08DRAFT_651479 [Tothia fuscella]|uniref:Uncharacterized protein n=1 Tax=Tothia fuscella TaxID=1048955 RepID=A0A9P4NM84_9PEZI|nr:hypothetical protein EJ08DRAFT_651479 [Tothia fuscella]